MSKFTCTFHMYVPNMYSSLVDTYVGSSYIRFISVRVYVSLVRSSSCEVHACSCSTILYHTFLMLAECFTNPVQESGSTIESSKHGGEPKPKKRKM